MVIDRGRAFAEREIRHADRPSSAPHPLPAPMIAADIERQDDEAATDATRSDAGEPDLYASAIAPQVNQYPDEAAKPPPMRQKAMQVSPISMHLL